MKRHVLWPIVLLVLSAGAALGVARLLTGPGRWPVPRALGYFDAESAPLTERDSNAWTSQVPIEWRDADLSGVFEHRHFGLVYRRMSTAKGDPPILGVVIDDPEQRRRLAARRECVMWRMEAGWPVRCLGGEEWYEIAGGDRLPSSFSRPRIFVGAFAANTAFYGGVLLALFSVLWCIRLVARRRSGRCLACGFIMKSASACPECGRRPRPPA